MFGGFGTEILMVAGVNSIDNFATPHGPSLLARISFFRDDTNTKGQRHDQRRLSRVPTAL